MKEIWKEIIDFDGNYKISNKGKIKSIERCIPHNNRTGNKKLKERILKPSVNKKGLLQICLNKDGKGKSFTIHRLVAIYFIDNPKNYPYVKHKDGNKTNNFADNLFWTDCQKIY